MGLGDRFLQWTQGKTEHKVSTEFNAWVSVGEGQGSHFHRLRGANETRPRAASTGGGFPLGPQLSAPLRNLLEMHILDPTPNLISQKRSG